MYFFRILSQKECQESGFGISPKNAPLFNDDDKIGKVTISDNEALKRKQKKKRGDRGNRGNKINVSFMPTIFYALLCRNAQRNSTATIAMPLLFSTKTAPVPQGTIVLMAPSMHMNSRVPWVHSAMPLVCLMSLSAALVQVATIVMNWGRQLTPRNAIKVSKR